MGKDKPTRGEGTISPLALDGRGAGGEGENVKGNNSNLLKIMGEKLCDFM